MSETELKPCPFCSAAPKTIERPDNIDGTEFVYAVFCHCEGYSATAHQMARRKTPAQAKKDAIAAWNCRASTPVSHPDPAGMEPVAYRRQDQHGGFEYEDGITSFAHDPTAEPLYTAAQVQTMGWAAPGWQAVPVEPTKEMKVAAVKFANGPAVYKAVAAAALEIEEGIYGEAYEAMLAAAPSGTAREPHDHIEDARAMVEGKP